MRLLKLTVLVAVVCAVTCLDRSASEGRRELSTYPPPPSRRQRPAYDPLEGRRQRPNDPLEGRRQRPNDPLVGRRQRPIYDPLVDIRQRPNDPLVARRQRPANSASANRRRLTPRPPTATEDPNFKEVSKVPCDSSNNYCGSVDPPQQFPGGGGFIYPG